MARKVLDVHLQFVDLGDDAVAALKGISASRGATLEEIGKRQAILADACLTLQKSIRSVIDMVKSLEDARGAAQE